MRVLIVRHGESENNLMTDSLAARGLAGDAYQQELLRLHQSDPSLTAKGRQEAQQLADFYAPIFAESGRRCHVFTSPFLRCCETTQPLASRLGASAEVTCHPDLHENGGVHAVVELPDGKLAFDDRPLRSRGPPGARGHAGKCMSAADIQSRFPGYGTRMLPPEGQWYVEGSETAAQSAERAARVATWLKHDQDLHDDIGDDAVMVLIMHGGFIDSLLKALLHAGGGPGAAAAVSSEHAASFDFPNTATASLNISRGGSVAVGWIGSTSHLNPGAHERAML